jgi:hypothetical protein
MASDAITAAKPGDEPQRAPAPSRHALLAGVAAVPTAAVPALAALAVPAPFRAAFAAALARFKLYSDTSVTNGMDEAFAALAKTPAPTVADLALKLGVLLRFVDDHDLRDQMTDVEWDVIWSCLDDAEALAAAAAA